MAIFACPSSARMVLGLTQQQNYIKAIIWGHILSISAKAIIDPIPIQADRIYQSINEVTDAGTEVPLYLYLYLKCKHTFHSNQSQLSTLIDLCFRQFQLCNQT